jgi:ribosome-binding factor A
MPREFSRKHRVAAEMQRILNELLLTEVKDPRLAGVRVSEVEVTGDLSLATIFFSTIEIDEDPANIKQGFEQARGFLRSRVANALQLRRVPELRFRHDATARRAAELQRLIDEAGKDSRPSD